MTKGDSYATESKEEVSRLSPAGDIETWFRIYATSKGGTRFHVEISEDQLERADEILTARAKKLDAI
ncbi:hypothetical protein ES708_12762 [subsurface metagenome]